MYLRDKILKYMELYMQRNLRNVESFNFPASVAQVGTLEGVEIDVE